MGVAWPPPDMPPGATVPPGTSWSDALLGARLLAADHPGIRALRLIGGSGEAVDAWLAEFRAMSTAPAVNLPGSADGDALRGGIDMEATLAAGRPVRSSGLIERSRGATIVVRGAERIAREAASVLASALDDGVLRLVLLDGGGENDTVPSPLLDRAAITLDLRTLRWRDARGTADARQGSDELGESRAERDARLPVLDDDALEALDRVATALGRAPIRRLSHLAALTRALAANGGVVQPAHLLAAVRLNTGTSLASNEEPSADPAPSEGLEQGSAEPGRVSEDDGLEPGARPPATDSQPSSGEASDGTTVSRAAQLPPTPEVVAAALLASLPPGLLEGVARTGKGEGRRSGGGADALRGSPRGLARRAPLPGARPAILPTLLAAVPWQRARGRLPGEPIRIRPSDLRWRRRRRPAGTTVVFAVDASGSAAAERLAEAKGAVEALLAEAYVRRDRVAVVAFRQGRARLLLSPTRGLVAAKRSLRDLPGGGATPLASGILAAAEICRAVHAAGERALLVLLTDGRGNVALDGTTGRSASREDERAAARGVRRAGMEALVIDTAARPGRHAPSLATEMGATLLTMPRSGGRDWAAAVSERLAE